MLDKISILNAVAEAESLDVAYDQKDILTVISNSLTDLYNVTKPYTWRHIYEHSVTPAHSYERYVFDHTVYQIVVMPVPARIEMLLDDDSAPYILKTDESLNMTTKSQVMAISNTANPLIVEDVRIYVYGRA